MKHFRNSSETETSFALTRNTVLGSFYPDYFEGRYHGEFPGLESPALGEWGRSISIKQQHVAQRLSVNAQLVSSMKLYLQSLPQLVFLSLFCVLITVKEADSTFVPGRCLCPKTQQGVRGQLKEISVYPKSPSCHKVTVIVTLKRTNQPVCLSPDAPMGRQLLRCWNRAHKLGRDVKVCLRRKRARGGQRQRTRQRNRGHSRRSSSSQ